ncbi:TPA: DUF4868 domain-containing protein [Pseudomonas aeruginosa]|uniref:DUF4868 domain-containing protein n=1 Tax=Azospira sp. I09 TaxID=1765049 RepID=UPI001261201D|nr:DUF4868 domain-containing protein [Azospira sp. I09]EKX9224154.1 DUF4868 domain-containing protein [Pseudomonas aeruginosa]MBN0116374.1 DUF4868 domain-containing protein [Pseudomonas aeruginosa]MBN0308725.1 DUF4868 domain-containing protein [Pseudomonas aeruginosa]MDP5933281.1 DUF4868 domain-containing protein [Pseudomonas aeruginosa]WJO56665.1 DUF4868 domain-containing protein [Pseudomonas aeruginosa]
MSNKTRKQLKEIKSEDFGGWAASFWLIKKRTSKESPYSALRVDMDRKLQNRFRRYLKQQLQGKDFHLAEYDYNNADGDDALFTIDAETTDFTKVAAEIGKGFSNQRVTSHEELLRSWAYVILFEKDDRKLYAWKKISADTQPKKAAAKDLAFFLNKKLVDLDDKEVFMIYPRYDFFVYGGTTFIANKRQFESSMNFREGMKAKAAQVIQDFIDSGKFENTERITRYVGENLHHLRKMASILKAGYYKQTDYIQQMIVVSKSEGWELNVKNGKVVVEDETIELLLKLLNNDRLRSPINNEVFDAAAKARVNGSKAVAA